MANVAGGFSTIDQAPWWRRPARGSETRAKTSFWKPLLAGIPLLAEMPFLDHLEELRRRIIKALIALAIGTGISFLYAAQLIRVLQKPATDLGLVIVARGAWEVFTLYFQVSLAGGICLAAPVILWQAWRFVEPALYPRERRYAGPFIVSTTVCFAAGAVFGYAVVTPYLMRLQKTLAELAGIIYQPDALEFVGLLTSTVVSMGLIFEMPPVVFILSRIGLINARFLVRNFKYAFLIFGVAAAVLTPSPDIPPMLAFMGVMTALYAVSIVTAAIFGRSRQDA